VFGARDSILKEWSDQQKGNKSQKIKNKATRKKTVIKKKILKK